MSWKIAPIGRGGDLLYSQAGTPSLDLRFAEKKALTDYVSGDNPVTFSRSSSAGDATYVDSDGLIKMAKVNYSLYSESLTNTWWSATLASISATSDVTPPAGIGSVYKITETASTGEHYFRGFQIILPLAVGTAITYSIYLNTSLGRSKVRVYSFGQNNLTFIWDLVNNVQVGSVVGGTSYSANSESLGNNWYRFSWTDAATVPSNIRPSLQIVNDLDQFNFAGDVTKGFYATGAQLETGSTATDYIPTTSSPGGAPRFDHDPTTGESLGLLVEEARTNLVNTSEDFSSWVKGTTHTIQPNAVASPSGANDATKLIPSAVSQTKYCYKSASAGATNVFSIYIKAAGYSKLQIRDIAASRFYVNFDLSTSNFVGGGADYISADITPAGNGWYRCSVINSTATAAYSVAGYPDSYDPGSSTPNFVGDGTSGIYIWGAQLEAGPFPTSYIPTSGATATRAADVAQITGTNFSSWFTQNTGTIFVRADLQSPSSAGQAPIVSVDASGVDFRVISRRLTLGARSASNTDLIDVTSGIWNGEQKKIAATWVPNDCVLVDDGTVAGTDTSTASPLTTVNQMLIGGVNTVGGIFPYMGGHISRLTYWPQRLPDTTLQTITT